jgi:hypothetical protein
MEVSPNQNRHRDYVCTTGSRCTIPHLNMIIYQRWVGRRKVSYHYWRWMNRRYLLCCLSTHFIRSIVLASDQGFFVGRSRITAFLLEYLEREWSKVGSTMTNQPCALHVFCPCIPSFALCGGQYLWPWTDCLARSVGPSVWAFVAPQNSFGKLL